MSTAREWFQDFTQDDCCWCGDAWVEFWFARMRVCFDKKLSSQSLSPIDDRPSDRQFEILDAILNYRKDFLTTLERALFDYYEESAYGMAAICRFGEEVTDRVAPELHSPAEIWKLIRAPYISIPYLEDTADDVVFMVVMNCTWDIEHGVCAVVRNWEIAADEVGQIGNFHDIFTR